MLSQRLVRILHSYTSMFMLLSMLFFTITGFTLNHRDWLPSNTTSTLQELPLPSQFNNPQAWAQDALTQGDHIRRWLRQTQNINGSQIRYDWSADEQMLVIDIKHPGGYSLIEVDLTEQLMIIEQQHFGVLAWLNNLHMGRYSGFWWRLFIDFSAVAMLIFTLTGFWLVLPQKRKRRALFLVGGLGVGLMFLSYALMFH